MNTRVIGIRSIFAKLIKAIKWLLISLVVLLLMAFVLESYLKHEDLQKFPPPGKLFQVNGHKMHIWCEGSGNPTIVLDAGASMFSTGWRWVMPELSQATKVCAFDRSVWAGARLELHLTMASPPQKNFINCSKKQMSKNHLFMLGIHLVEISDKFIISTTLQTSKPW